MDLTQWFAQKAKKPISGLANWLLVPPIVQFSNSFHDNLFELYSLKDSLITENLIDYNAFSKVFQVKQHR